MLDYRDPMAAQHQLIPFITDNSDGDARFSSKPQAFTGGVDYSVRKVGGGIRSMIGSGEGLVMELSGSGLVWVQTRNLSSLTSWMKSLLKNSDNG